MRKLTITVVAALCLIGNASADRFKERAAEIRALYTQGLTAMNAGRSDAARASFKRILELEPNHGHAKYQLSRLKSFQKNFLLEQRKKKFTTTKLEVVDFHEATLSEVVETLNHLTTAATKKTWSPNFVIQDPKGLLKEKEITLTMKNVPVGAALKYVLEMANAKVRYDQHATVITPIRK